MVVVGAGFDLGIAIGVDIVKRREVTTVLASVEAVELRWVVERVEVLLQTGVGGDARTSSIPTRMHDPPVIRFLEMMVCVEELRNPPA